MTKIIFCFALSTFFLLPVGQAQDFAKVDAHARSIPFPKNQDVGALAQALAAGCVTEREQLRSFFVWICDNIKYDVKTFENRNNIDPQEQLEQQLPPQVLKSKKAVCAGYSNLLLALCAAVGLQALKVEGITKNYKGVVPRVGHAWCLVRTEGQYGFIDATWGAGNVDLDEGKYIEHFDEQYFWTSPEAMITTHFPHDPLFQLLSDPLTVEEFRQRPAEAKAIVAKKLSNQPQKGFAHLTDSLDAFIALDSVTGFFSMGQRVLRLDPASNYGLYKLSRYHYEIGLRSMDAYGAELNECHKARKTVTIVWCDQQLARVKDWKAHMAECIKITGRTNHTDNCSAPLRSVRQAADSYSRTIEKQLSYLKQLRSQAK